jgi:hypothetical protein
VLTSKLNVAKSVVTMATKPLFRPTPPGPLSENASTILPLKVPGSATEFEKLNELE